MTNTACSMITTTETPRAWRMNSLLRLAAMLSLLVGMGVAAESVVLSGATIHPVSSAPIENGMVLIRNGKIEAVGQNLEIPEDAERIDLEGMHLYPGFIHPLTAIGLTEIASVRGTVDVAEMGNINAALRAEVAVDPDSMVMPVSIAGGILSAHIAPGGGLIRGSSAIISLDGWTWEQMTLAAPVGMHIAFPSGAVDDNDNEDLKRIERALDQARHWHQARRAAEDGRAPVPAENDQLDALGPVLDGSLPVFLHAQNERVMRAALDWAAEQELSRIVLVGGADLQYLAERLADDNTPVILTGVYSLPTRRWEPYDMAFVAPAKLHEAGVRFAIADSGGSMNVTNARNLPFQAGSAAAFGLPPEAALSSVTLAPAQILGIDDRLGSIEPGKQATLFAANGDPLEPMTRIKRVWIDGAEYDLDRDRQRQLYQRYLERLE